MRPSFQFCCVAAVWVLLMSFLASVMPSVIAQDKAAITDADRVPILQAQLRSNQAFAAVLQTPQYTALQVANSEVEKAITDLEKRAGCKLDRSTLSCQHPHATTQ